MSALLQLSFILIYRHYLKASVCQPYKQLHKMDSIFNFQLTFTAFPLLLTNPNGCL